MPRGRKSVSTITQSSTSTNGQHCLIQSTYQCGSVVWCKYKKYPYWPGIILKEVPQSNQILYEVLFFGTLDLGLSIDCKSLEPYEGATKFQRRIKELQASENCITNKRSQYDMNIALRNLESFKEAVKHASQVLKCSNSTERLELVDNMRKGVASNFLELKFDDEEDNVEKIEQDNDEKNEEDSDENNKENIENNEGNNDEKNEEDNKEKNKENNEKHEENIAKLNEGNNEDKREEENNEEDNYENNEDNEEKNKEENIEKNEETEEDNDAEKEEDNDEENEEDNDEKNEEDNNEKNKEENNEKPEEENIAELNEGNNYEKMEEENNEQDNDGKKEEDNDEKNEEDNHEKDKEENIEKNEGNNDEKKEEDDNETNSIISEDNTPILSMPLIQNDQHVIQTTISKGGKKRKLDEDDDVSITEISRIRTTNELEQPSMNFPLSTLFRHSTDQPIVMCSNISYYSLSSLEEMFILDAITSFRPDCTFFQAKQIAEETYSNIIRLKNSNRPLPVSEVWFYIFFNLHFEQLFSKYPRWLGDLEKTKTNIDYVNNQQQQLIRRMKTYVQ